MLEFKRSINNKSFIFCFLTIILSFLIGYFLLVGLDKIENVTIEQFSFSLYTVMTQFGPMIYSVVIINSLNQDYRDKNIMFIKKSGTTALVYLLKKILVIFFWFGIFTTLLYTVVCLSYSDFTYYFVMISSYLNVLIYIVLISALCGFLFKNILVAYGFNLFLWILGIIMVAVIPSARFIAYFDASNSLYQNLEKYFETGNSQLLNLGESVLYNIIIFIIILVIAKLLSKVWLKNGIK